MIAIFAYLMVCLYVAGFLTLSVITSQTLRRSVWLFGTGEARQRWTGLAFRAAFLGALLWPALRLWQHGSGGSLPSGLLLHSAPVTIIGTLLITLGASLALVSQYHMKSAWRIGAAEGQQGQLVVTGPFSWSRNPVFVGQGALFIGLLLVFPDPIQLAITITALLAIRSQVQIEEHVLRVTFGATYEDYAHRVPRWTGKISPRIVTTQV